MVDTNNNIRSEDLQKILVAFLVNSDRPLTYDDLSKSEMLSEISNSSIHRGVLNLQRRSILDMSPSRGKPKGGERVKNFCLIRRKIIFNIFFS